MSKIHYFQRYSQKENVVTNNTLLLFSRLYNDSPSRFEDFINSLLDNDRVTLEIGLRFRQQEGNKSGSSTPDGSIIQKGMKVLVETKLNDNNDSSQLSRHLDGFDNEDTQVLMLVNETETSKRFNLKVHKIVDEFNQKNGSHIEFCSVTFKEIIDAVDDVLFEYDVEFNEMLNDYREFCAAQGLLPRHKFMMRAITSSGSFKQNMQFNIYYDAASRGFAPHNYIGLYRDKSVKAIGVLKKVVLLDADMKTKKVTKVESRLGEEPTENEKGQILSIMEVALSENGWNVFNNHQFFIVEEFVPTDFKKITKYPIQRTKFFDLGSELELEELPDCAAVAELLRQKTWD
jgi:hypothetical protein